MNKDAIRWLTTLAGKRTHAVPEDHIDGVREWIIAQCGVVVYPAHAHSDAPRCQRCENILWQSGMREVDSDG